MKRDFRSPAPSRPTSLVQITEPRSSKSNCLVFEVETYLKGSALMPMLSRGLHRDQGLPRLKTREDQTRDNANHISGVGIPERDTLWDRGIPPVG
jgi:hypothetical protein